MTAIEPDIDLMGTPEIAVIAWTKGRVPEIRPRLLWQERHRSTRVSSRRPSVGTPAPVSTLCAP